MSKQPRSFRWGSHLPVLKAATKVICPKNILELGTGLFSTSFLFSTGIPMTSIENDPKWFDEISTKYQSPNFRPLLHQLPYGITNRIHSKMTAHTPEVTALSRKYYLKLLKRLGPFDLVFVDQFAILRQASLEVFAPSSQCVIFHDSHEPWYGYKEFIEKFDFTDFYFFDFKSIVPTTGFLIRKTYDRLLLDQKLRLYGEEYCTSFGTEYNHNLDHRC